MDDSAVRERVARLLRTGELPDTLPERCLGGPGSGRQCRACMSLIAAEDFELEVGEDLVLHPGCYQIWIAELGRWRREQRER